MLLPCHDANEDLMDLFDERDGSIALKVVCALVEFADQELDASDGMESC